MDIVKQAVGIDVSQKELVVCLGRMDSDFTPELYAHKVFNNTEHGFKTLLLWVKTHTLESIKLRFVMEATGVYHESFAYFLDEKGYELSVVLPNKISNYIRSFNLKSKNDKSDSRAIAMFGLERKLDSWHRPKPIYREMKQLTRERDQVLHERTMVKNQLHAEKVEAHPNKRSIERLNERIKLLNSQEKEIKTEISDLIKADNLILEIVGIICTIPGIGLVTAAIILAETNGFELIKNKRQLVSYAGLDVRERQSGTSINGKARITKRGNKHLRKALYFPAWTAIRYDERFKLTFSRHVSKHGVKMKVGVVIQRKLLELVFALYKTRKPYDKEYLNEYEEGMKNKVAVV
ncbi:IS110 family RNA-guided transposase [Brumimicrobium aurantiacum]|uniref:IS110 family transposase n=1 Tax=Brumimicrobium aurantiacum TaxID=1737063 RepID=A0A3E1EU98_9FLAO|nr:IS110 family transposase [Brumimicrobium aurantiacum]RFC53146.1 IS110 family transposase [Brumimicrobium aurantiacum]